MKIAKLAFLSMLISTSAFAITKIESKNASFYQGSNVIACGELKQVSRFKRGVYLNLDNNFPKQSLTLVVWENDLNEFNKLHGSMQDLINTVVCGKGEITDYKGRNQISLYNAYSFQTHQK